jgi:hypothetical protein
MELAKRYLTISKRNGGYRSESCCDAFAYGLKSHSFLCQLCHAWQYRRPQLEIHLMIPNLDFCFVGVRQSPVASRAGHILTLREVSKMDDYSDPDYYSVCEDRVEGNFAL